MQLSSSTRLAPVRKLSSAKHVIYRPSTSVLAAVGRDAECSIDRRSLLSGLAVSSVAIVLNMNTAEAADLGILDYKKELARRRKKIPESDYKVTEQGLKVYDIVVGDGKEAVQGDRVAVHYDIKFRNVTFVTSRVGMGVTGGTPFGFNVGTDQNSAGGTLKGLDLCTTGMRVGGLRRCLIPPELGYGSKGVGEIPGGATLQLDVELLSIKTNPLGYRVKLVEG